MKYGRSSAVLFIKKRKLELYWKNGIFSEIVEPAVFMKLTYVRDFLCSFWKSKLQLREKNDKKFWPLEVIYLSIYEENKTLFIPILPYNNYIEYIWRMLVNMKPLYSLISIN